MKKDGVSIIITAYNEEGNIAYAVHSAIHAVSSILPRFEIIIVDDASYDGTERIGRQLAHSSEVVHYVRRQSNGGLGQAFLTGMKHASMPYVTWFPGDNDTSGKSIQDLVKQRHNADLIITFTANPQTRSWLRRIISSAFTWSLNSLLGFHLRYYNGCFIAKTDLVRSIPLKSTGHAIFAELKVRLLKKGVSYKEIAFYHIGRKSGKTTAFKWKNVVATLNTIIVLLRDRGAK